MRMTKIITAIIDIRMQYSCVPIVCVCVCLEECDVRVGIYSVCVCVCVCACVRIHVCRVRERGQLHCVMNTLGYQWLTLQCWHCCLRLTRVALFSNVTASFLMNSTERVLCNDLNHLSANNVHDVLLRRGMLCSTTHVTVSSCMELH